jgi:hypothetical protein
MDIEDSNLTEVTIVITNDFEGVYKSRALEELCQGPGNIVLLSSHYFDSPGKKLRFKDVTFGTKKKNIKRIIADYEHGDFKQVHDLLSFTLKPEKLSLIFALNFDSGTFDPSIGNFLSRFEYKNSLDNLTIQLLDSDFKELKSVDEYLIRYPGYSSIQTFLNYISELICNNRLGFFRKGYKSINLNLPNLPYEDSQTCSRLFPAPSMESKKYSFKGLKIGLSSQTTSIKVSRSIDPPIHNFQFVYNHPNEPIPSFLFTSELPIKGTIELFEIKETDKALTIQSVLETDIELSNIRESVYYNNQESRFELNERIETSKPIREDIERIHEDEKLLQDYARALNNNQNPYIQIQEPFNNQESKFELNKRIETSEPIREGIEHIREDKKLLQEYSQALNNNKSKWCCSIF